MQRGVAGHVELAQLANLLTAHTTAKPRSPPRERTRRCRSTPTIRDPSYLQVASVLRAAILTKKFPPGAKLPSRNELATTYDVAPMTVQSALRELRNEGLIVSRQGSGVFVRRTLPALVRT
jgi:DNA-binding GntR family transcriptional regulator